MTPHGSGKSGSWAKRVCPWWCFSLYDAAERLGCSVRHVRRLLRKYNISKGLLIRPVRLADGRIVTRHLTTLTPTALQNLLLAHAGYRTLKAGSPKADIETDFPLSIDLETRPRGTESVSVSRAVGPSIMEWVDQAIQERQRLLLLADQASENGDLASELACVKKASDMTIKLLRLGKE